MAFGGLAGDDTGGDRERPAVVLLHGLTFERRTWAPVVEAFRALDPDRRVLALDLPGHGESPPRPPHDLPLVAEVVHEALAEAGVDRPVMVGHSVAGALVTFYGAAYPVTGVVNVDQPMVIRPFAELVKSVEAQLRGADFDQLWSMFFRSFEVERLPPDARRLVEETCRPRQETVISYWSLILERPVGEIEAMIDGVADRLAAAGTPYLFVTGHQPPDPVLMWLQERIPQADVAVWDGTGHFPHLARPQDFARLLASTTSWSE